MADQSESQLRNLHIWLQQLLRYEHEGARESPEDLVDGVAISRCLGGLAPEFFDEEWMAKINKKTSNWRVATNNIRKLTSKLQDYYERVCEEELSDFDWPNPNAIGERKDMQQLCSLLQLVLGVVFCQKQEADIMQIQQLDQDVQKSIMDVFHELQKRLPASCFDLPTSNEGTGDVAELNAKLTEMSEAHRRLEERNRQLELERNSLEQQRDALAADNERLTSAATDVTDGQHATEKLKEQLEEFQQRVIDLGNERDEADYARDQFRKTSEKHEETIRQLRQQNRDLLDEMKDDTALQDELDLLRKRVRDYETQVEKYKQKLDGMADIRQRLKTVEDERSRFERQSREFEEKNRAARSQLDVYRQKVEDLEENVNAEAERAVEAKLAARKLREKLDQSQRQLKNTREELTDAQDQLAEKEALQYEVDASASGSTDPVDSRDSSEEIRRLKAEIESLKALSEVEDLRKQNAKLQAELSGQYETHEELRREMRTREHDLMVMNRHLKDLDSGSGARPPSDERKASTTDTPDSTVVVDLKRVLAEVRLQVKTLKSDLEQRNKKLEEKNALNNSIKDKLAKKEEELLVLRGKHKGLQEKTRSTIKLLQENHDRTLKQEIQEREKRFKELQEYCKQQEEKTEKVREGYEIEQRILISSWNHASEQLQRQTSQARLAARTDATSLSSAMPASFLSRQRQALLHQQSGASFTGPGSRTTGSM